MEDSIPLLDIPRVIATLARDVENRDDAQDWEDEGLDKPRVIAELRSLPAAANVERNSDHVLLRFLPGEISDTVDLAVGVAAGVTAAGCIATIVFDLSCSAAAVRINAEVYRGAGYAAGTSPPTFPGGPQTETHAVVAVERPAMEDASLVNVSSLLAALVKDIEERDDEDTWEEDGLNKGAVLARLRELPRVARCDYSGLAAPSRLVMFHFQFDAVTSSIDLSVGVTAEQLGDGSVAALVFELDREPAARRLEAVPEVHAAIASSSR